MSSEESPEYSPFFAVMGASAAMVFSALGAAYGTAKSGTGIAAMSVMRPELIMKSIIPVVMAGIIAIYGLVVAVLIANNISERVTLYKSFLHLGAGLSVGLSGLAAGFAIGIVGDAAKQQEQIGDFHLLPLHPVGLTGWDGNRNTLAVDLTAVPSIDVIYPYCLKPSSCVRSRAYRTGMKMYWLLWDDVWTVCLICCLILTCTVIQSPSTPSVNVVTSLCCECEYQRLSLCPLPLLEFCFCWWF
uniref:V-type proton ATPase proteolipid subunit n=1 Tax=Sparus aurata TaxID=8175 RepID=A0A671UDK7_SPAAU